MICVSQLSSLFVSSFSSPVWKNKRDGEIFMSGISVKHLRLLCPVRMTNRLLLIQMDRVKLGCLYLLAIKASRSTVQHSSMQWLFH